MATFRTDDAYSDGRHPDSVSFTDAQHDAQRRDFTINGLFYDPIAEHVVDYVGGKVDLNRGIIRAIGDPRLRLSEDKLRMLRAVRFAATFGFEIESATLHAVQDMAADITTVSAERIGMEVRRMLLDANRSQALGLLRDTNLLPSVLPEVSALPAMAFDKTKSVLAALHEPTLPLALAALLSQEREISNAPTTDQKLAPHSSLLAATVGRRLRYTNKEVDRTAWLLANRAAIADAPSLPWPRLQRPLTHEGADELLALHEAIAGSDEVLAFCRERLAWPTERLNPSPLVDGSDLIRHGLKPGPHFSDLLERARDAQLIGEIHTRDEALALIDRLREPPKTLP